MQILSYGCLMRFAVLAASSAPHEANLHLGFFSGSMRGSVLLLQASYMMRLSWIFGSRSPKAVRYDGCSFLTSFQGGSKGVLGVMSESSVCVT